MHRLTLTVIFLGSKFIPKFCMPFANFDNGLVNVFSCFSAFSLCELLKFNDKSLCCNVDLRNAKTKMEFRNGITDTLLSSGITCYRLHLFAFHVHYDLTTVPWNVLDCHRQRYFEREFPVQDFVIVSAMHIQAYRPACLRDR